MDDLDANNNALTQSLNTLNEEVNKAIGRAPVSTRDLADKYLETPTYASIGHFPRRNT